MEVSSLAIVSSPRSSHLVPIPAFLSLNTPLRFSLSSRSSDNNILSNRSMRRSRRNNIAVWLDTSSIGTPLSCARLDAVFPSNQSFDPSNSLEGIGFFIMSLIACNMFRSGSRDSAPREKVSTGYLTSSGGNFYPKPKGNIRRDIDTSTHEKCRSCRPLEEPSNFLRGRRPDLSGRGYATRHYPTPTYKYQSWVTISNNNTLRSGSFALLKMLKSRIPQHAIWGRQMQTSNRAPNSDDLGQCIYLFNKVEIAEMLKESVNNLKWLHIALIYREMGQWFPPSATGAVNYARFLSANTTSVPSTSKHHCFL
jgi:hypothetical protein